MISDKDTYLAPVKYLIGRDIREWDISKANISILRYLGVIDNVKYTELYNADRMYRQVQVGLMQKDERVSRALSNGFKQMRAMFCEANGIVDTDILSIKKDAIYLVDKIPPITSFSNQNGDVTFVSKHQYTSFFKLGGLELYFYHDIRDVSILDVKGISDNVLELHKPYMLDFMSYIFKLLQRHMLEDAVDSIQGFYNDYISISLPIGYYRELDNRSLYKTNYNIGGFTYVPMVHVIDDQIDISYNAGIVRELYSIVASLMISKNS